MFVFRSYPTRTELDLQDLYHAPLEAPGALATFL
jgi:hypothetical protein